MKRKLVTILMLIVLSVGVVACGQRSTDMQPDDQEKKSDEALAEKTEPTVSKEGFAIQEISDELFARMQVGNTYKEDCVVPREDLRYLLVLHKDKDGNTHQGEMVVHKLIAEDVLEIFEKL